MAHKIHVATLVFCVQNDGYIRLDAHSGPVALTRREGVALRRWLRDWPERSLNECDHLPFTCAERGKKLCGACAVRAALGLPPLKAMHSEPAPPALPAGEKESK